MKKYMVRCDVEGVTGVVSYEQAEPGKSEYAFGERMFMHDLRALLDGLRAGGADEVVIYDEHYYGRTIDLEALPDFATAICGKPPYRKDWSGGLDDSFAGLILLGFHAKAGTPGSLLPHSYALENADLLLDGVSVGEIGMEAAIAGDHNVPTLLVVADSAGAAEAEALLPGVQTAVVKDALSDEGALCYPVCVTGRRIREAAERVVKEPPAVPPYTLTSPVTLEVRLADGPYLKAVRKLHGGQMKDDCTLLIQGETATDVWAQHWQMSADARALAARTGGEA